MDTVASQSTEAVATVCRKTLEIWLLNKQPNRELFVVPEMGPKDYNLAQLPNSWEDAKVLRRIIEKTRKKVYDKRFADQLNTQAKERS